MNATHAGSVSVSRESSSSLPDIAVLAMDGRIDSVVKECLRQILEPFPVESQGIRPDKAADEHCLYQDQWGWWGKRSGNRIINVGGAFSKWENAAFKNTKIQSPLAVSWNYCQLYYM